MVIAAATPTCPTCTNGNICDTISGTCKCGTGIACTGTKKCNTNTNTCGKYLYRLRYFDVTSHILLLSWVYISFLLRVYFHISGTEFYLGGEGKLCSNSLAIGDLNECKLAVSQLANTGLDIQFSREESALDWPFGCYEVGGANWTNAYWNSNSAGKSNPFARPICKGY